MIDRIRGHQPTGSVRRSNPDNAPARSDADGRDHGSVTIEVALLAPVLLALLGLCSAAGRYETAASAVDAATSAAARAASLARNATQAHRDATMVATTALAGQTPA